MWPLSILLGALVYLTAIFLDVTIFFLVVRALRTRFHGELVTALDEVGRPLVSAVSRRTQYVVAHLAGRAATEQGAQALALVVCVAVRTAISCVVVGCR
jgi:hypothetical protein